MKDQQIQGSSLYWGLLRAQGSTALLVAILVAVAGDVDQILIALWGGAISVVAYAWAGFQLWMHPGNHKPGRQASAAIRAEVGKVVIILLLFWLTLKWWPDVRGPNALILFAAFFVAQLVGWVWLARRLAREDEGQGDWPAGDTPANTPDNEGNEATAPRSPERGPQGTDDK